MRSFDELLEDVFEGNCSSFNPHLRFRLQQLWSEGVKTGIFLERENLPVPEQVVDAVIPPPTNQSVEEVEELDPRLAPGKFIELEKMKNSLISKVEDFTILLETIDPSPLLKLQGEDFVKARHSYLVFIARLERGILDYSSEVRKFKILK